uniref:Putative tnf receptor-associated factor 3 n=1 Tax=Amblyomma aureolatum TaxID=187763 RepID=A0A1E1X952_9ACAR
MPPVGLRYTLVGFSAGLDWRPLHFLEPIPQNRICRACGLVCRRTALLPCMHGLCESCYGQCAQGGEVICPLDDQNCQDGEVDWEECPVDEILRREVVCWNEGDGCGAVMAASEIYRHFRHECGHHSASCSKCSARVLRRDMCSHLRSACRDLVMPVTSPRETPQLSSRDEAGLSFLIRSLEQRACETGAFFERLSSDGSPRGKRLLEICHGLNTLRETLGTEISLSMDSVLGELAERVRQNHESSSTNRPAIVTSNDHMNGSLTAGASEIENLSNTMKTARDALKNVVANATRQNAERVVNVGSLPETSTADGGESCQQTLNCARTELRLPKLCLDSCVFFVNDVQSLKESALKVGHKFFFIRVVYLRGYCMQPGLKFVKDGSSARLHICFFIRKGYVDEALEWPFRHEIRLSFINAVTDAVREVIFKPISSALQGPTESDQCLIKVEFPSLSLDDLVRDGYVHDGKLLVKWELLA